MSAKVLCVAAVCCGSTVLVASSGQGGPDGHSRGTPDVASGVGWRYSIEVGRLNNGKNVFYDSHHRPDTTDFAHNFGPGYVKMLDGTDALVIRSCVNVTGCSTVGNPDVITLVKRSRDPVDLANLQAQFQKNSLERIILRPEGADEQCGVQDPRITVDRSTGIYYLTYCAYGDQQVPPRSPKVCADVKTKVAVSKTPEDANSWQRLSRTGDPGYDEKSTAMLIRDHPPHFQWTGTGTVRSWQSDDLLHWVEPQVAISGRQTEYDPGYCEAGAPPAQLADGNYITTYDTIINDGRGPEAGALPYKQGQPQCQSAFCSGWGAGWAILNGSDPRQVLQRGNEPLWVPTMPSGREQTWEFGPNGGGPEWNWTQNPSIGSTNGLMPLGDDSFVAWGCASDSLIEAFVVRVSTWSDRAVAQTMIVGVRYNDTDIAGDNIGPVPATSIDGCKAACEKEPTCDAFVFDHRGNGSACPDPQGLCCWLKGPNPTMQHAIGRWAMRLKIDDESEARWS